MLIASFYPHWPTLTSDNQYHLQALRHLYEVASYKRVFASHDVESNEKVCIPIELSVANSNAIALASTPFLVANGSAFAQLRSKSDRYNPIVIDATSRNTRGDLPTIFESEDQEGTSVIFRIQMGCYHSRCNTGGES